jgi:hypothetical protein
MLESEPKRNIIFSGIEIRMSIELAIRIFGFIRIEFSWFIGFCWVLDSGLSWVG